MDLEIAEDGLAIVMRGHFNPAIVTPDWLLAQDLIGPSEAEAARIELMIPDVTIFALPWLRAEITEDRLLFVSQDAQEYARCRDLTFGIFSLLKHTPVSALGLNRWAHIKAGSVEAWHVIGDRLAPKDIWNDALVLPGVMSVSMMGVRPDHYSGNVIVRTEPSRRHGVAVFVEVNDHYTLKKGVAQPVSRLVEPEIVETVASFENVPVALEILTEGWNASMKRSDRLIQHVWSLRK